MGSFFTDVLSFKHETAVFDVNPQKLRFMYNCYRYTTLDEIREFSPELVINAATVKYTLDAFNQVLPALPKEWKNGCFKGFCARGGKRVSCEWKDGRIVSSKITENA